MFLQGMELCVEVPRTGGSTHNGGVAQLGEHLNGIQGVRGSNPLTSTVKKGTAHLITAT